MTDTTTFSVAPAEKPRFTVACVAEPYNPYLSEAASLFKTLRLLSGTLRDSDAVLYVTGELPQTIAKEFAELHVQIYVVESFDPRCSHANKIQMIGPEYHTDYLLAVDTDIVFAGDPSSIILGKTLVAKIVDQDPLSIQNWQTLFAHFDLDLPPDRYLTDFHNSETIPYFNSGVLCIPTFLTTSLKTGWATIARKLLDTYEELPAIAPHRFFTDQLSLSLAICKEELPYRAAPLALNFPTHAQLHSERINAGVPPVVLHHHHKRNEDGSLDYCGQKEVDQIIDKVNTVLVSPHSCMPFKANNDSTFNNKEFWNHRYVTNRQLGSGIGSRGEVAELKRKWIDKFLVEINAASILDIGCGDMEVIGALNLKGKKYHGLDVSNVIIEQNKQLYPHYQFTAGDVINIDNIEDYESDAVLCFDVLIHQHLRNDYDRLVRRLIELSRKGGLVSGYVSYPRRTYRSEIISYHEPITETLARMGAKNVTIVGNYRDTPVVRFLR